jgi:hypothetical protein
VSYDSNSGKLCVYIVHEIVWVATQKNSIKKISLDIWQLNLISLLTLAQNVLNRSDQLWKFKLLKYLSFKGNHSFKFQQFELWSSSGQLQIFQRFVNRLSLNDKCLKNFFMLLFLGRLFEKMEKQMQNHPQVIVHNITFSSIRIILLIALKFVDKIFLEHYMQLQ